ncbi:MAG: hypothetical protein P1Q69_10435 [Candidatus Thorarchaeota archaeon]|nr:hypothetical protein [Candidatus Thorarchaeota archaeon]
MNWNLSHVCKETNSKVIGVLLLLVLSTSLSMSHPSYSRDIQSRPKIKVPSLSEGFFSIPENTFFEYTVSLNSVHFLNNSYGVYPVDDSVRLVAHFLFGSTDEEGRRELTLSYSSSEPTLIIPDDSIPITLSSDSTFEVLGGTHSGLTGQTSLFGDLNWNGEEETITVATSNNSQLIGEIQYNPGERQNASGDYQEVFFVAVRGTSFLGDDVHATYYFDYDTGIVVSIRGTPSDYLLLVLSDIDWIWDTISLTGTNYDLGPTIAAYPQTTLLNPLVILVPAVMIGFIGFGLYRQKRLKYKQAATSTDRGPDKPRKKKKRKRW